MTSWNCPSRLRFWLVIVLAVLAGRASLRGHQQPTPPAAQADATSGEESTGTSQAWTLLARGKALEAATLATNLLKKFPRSLPVLVVGVEADIASAGAAAALSRYEAWLGSRSLEEPGVLRTISYAILNELSKTEHKLVRVAALNALVDAGDIEAGERLQKTAYAGGLAETGALAANGDSGAVQILIAQLGGDSNRMAVIEALGKSGNIVAVEPLTVQLGDQEPTVRGTAADALGNLGDPKAIPFLKAMLADQSGFVRVNAAGALYKLGDDSGLNIINELASSSEPSSRIEAALALASRPDDRWLSLVRELTSVSDPEIRLASARLLAPHDPGAARLVLDDLAGNDNPVIREQAALTTAADLPSNMTRLRSFLKHDDQMVQVAAAGKILALTR
jgi:HEAT repeat protein